MYETSPDKSPFLELAYVRLGNLFRTLQRFKEAEEWIQKAIDSSQERYGEGHYLSVSMKGSLALILTDDVHVDVTHPRVDMKKQKIFMRRLFPLFLIWIKLKKELLFLTTLDS